MYGIFPLVCWLHLLLVTTLVLPPTMHMHSVKTDGSEIWDTGGKAGSCMLQDVRLLDLLVTPHSAGLHLSGPSTPFAVSSEK